MRRFQRDHSTLEVNLVLTSFLALDPTGALAQGNLTVSAALPATPAATVQQDSLGSLMAGPFNYDVGPMRFFIELILRDANLSNSDRREAGRARRGPGLGLNGVTPDAGSMWPTLNRYNVVSTASAFGVDTPGQPVSTSIALDEDKTISLHGYTGRTRTDPNATGSGARADTDGLSFLYVDTDDLGTDKRRSWGLNGGIGEGKVKSLSSPDNTSIESWNIGAIGGLQWQDGAYMATSVGYSENRSKSQRFTADGGLPAVALGTFTGKDTSGSIELGKTYRLGKRADEKDGDEKTASARQSRRASWELAPQMALQLRHFEQDAFTETGAGASSLNIGVIQVDTVQTSVGARLSRPTPTSNGGLFVLQLTLRYAHEFGDTHANIVSSFVGTSTTLVSESSRLSRDSVQVSAGATLSTRDSWDLSANYVGQFASNYDNQTATATVSYRFH